MEQPSSIVVEDVNSTILMPRSSKSSVHGLPAYQPPPLAELDWRHTKSMLIPKLHFVSNSRILAPLARLSHTLILPSKDVAARYCPSSERATAHVSPTLLPSTQISAPYSFQIGQLWRREGRTHNLRPFTPPPIISCCPDHDLASEAHTSGYQSISAYGGMVAT